MKTYITNLIPEKIKHEYRLRKYPHYKENYEYQKEIERLQKIPRFLEGITYISSKPLKYIDTASFIFIYDEIYKKEIYKFLTPNPEPYIIDAGANIGLSVVYFKQLFPKAEIIAFEPDEKVFDVLAFNVKSFGLENVNLVQKALWNEETILKFYAEGADGGRVATENDELKIVEVPTISLRPYLNKKVDLLKIDIEGAETVVLKDCKDLLHNVERVFIEYHSFVGQEQTLQQILEILQKAGFRYQLQHIGIFSANPFIKVNEYNNMDLQLNIFAYRP